MIETVPLRKNKITLSDYNFRRDIDNRLLMAQFSTLDVEILEEILFSSLILPLSKLARNIEVEESKILPILEKFSQIGLLTLQGNTIVVDKEMRKYYESQILKFDEEFTPGMEFLQSLLKMVPIPVLPTWYSIPRSSNNIFDSLIEKYLLTPQIFHRHLMELHFEDAILPGIIRDVHESPDLKVCSADLIEKYHLTREQFEENILYLEFNFVCCLGYTKIGEMWKETVTPFHEWHEYLHFLRRTETQPIVDLSSIVRKRPDDFAFIQDLALLLKMAKKQPFSLITVGDGYIPERKIFAPVELDLQRLISKLLMLDLADIVDGKLYALQSANNWLDMNLENRALYVYRHPLNSLNSDRVAPHLCTERNIREAEKSIVRVLNSGWVYFDDFIKGVQVVLSDNSNIILKKMGKSWKYVLPEYDDEEKELIKAVIFEWLYEVGMVAIGTHQGKECFSATPFGRAFFGR